MKGSKVKEHVCPACGGTGYPVVKQQVQPSLRIYPVKCESCNGKGKISEPTGPETIHRWSSSEKGKAK